MNCDQAQQRLNALLDERRRPHDDNALGVHLAACDACHELACAYDALIDCVEPHHAAPPLRLASRVVESLETGASACPRSPARRHPYRRPALLAIVLSLAASLLVAASIEWTGRGEAAPRTPAEQLLADYPATSLPLRLPSELGTLLGYEQLCQSTGRRLAALPVTVRHAAPWRDLAEYPGAIRPMALSMEATLGALLHVWPRSEYRSEKPSGDTGFLQPTSPLVVV